MIYLKRFKNWLDMYPPECATIGGLEELRKKNKIKYQIRYWITEVLIPNIWWPIERKYKAIVSYIRFGYFEKMHIIDTRLKPGYYDKDTLLLHGMFSLLKDFVEVEKAWMEAIFNENYKRPLWKLNSRFRSKELGIKYLDWEISLQHKEEDFPGEKEVYISQSKSAQTIKDLYLWWTNIRSNRMDPYDLLRDCDYDNMLSGISGLSKPMSEEKKNIYKEINKLEQQYVNEDTKMLIKLVNVRQTLWT